MMRAEGVKPLRGRSVARPRPAPKPAPAPPPMPAPLAPPVDDLHTKLREAIEARERAEDEVARLRHERSVLQRRLAAVGRTAPAPAVPIAQVLANRGLRDDEGARALTELLGTFETEVMEALALADPEPLEALLGQRLVLTAEPDGVGEEAVVLPVPVDRCELGSGSDQRTAWRAFAEACANAKVDRLCIVGGSPNYRQRLDALAKTSGPQLDLVAGHKPLRRHRVESAVRRADRIVIWGATILAHAVSQPFVDLGGDKVVLINHRGLSGMLDRVRARLDP